MKPNKAARDAAIDNYRWTHPDVATHFQRGYDAGFADAQKWHTMDDPPKVNGYYQVSTLGSGTRKNRWKRVPYVTNEVFSLNDGFSDPYVYAWRERPEPCQEGL